MHLHEERKKEQGQKGTLCLTFVSQGFQNFKIQARHPRTVRIQNFWSSITSFSTRERGEP